MNDQAKKETLLDSWLKNFKNHPIIATLIMVTIVLAGIASFTDSIDKLKKFVGADTVEEDFPVKDSVDSKFEQEILGTWKSNSNVPTPDGNILLDLRYTLLDDGSINWRGTYLNNGDKFPIMMSGKWRIEKSMLKYKVESSNVPQVISEGFSSITKIIEIKDDRLVYIDTEDGKIKEDTRLN